MTNWRLTDESRFVREGQPIRGELTFLGRIMFLVVLWLSAFDGFCLMVVISKWLMERFVG